MRTRLQPVDVGEASEEAVSRETPAQSAFTSLLTVSLKALSQRALVALASLVDLALIASAFVLWLNVIEQPSVLQLVGVGMYAAFILVAIWVRTR
jgi:hypothetical protein